MNKDSIAFRAARFNRTVAISSILLLSLVAIFLLDRASAQSQQSLKCVQIGGSPLDNSSSQIFVRAGYPAYVNITSASAFVNISSPSGRAIEAASTSGDGIMGYTTAAGKSAVYGLASNPNAYSGFFEGGKGLVVNSGSVGIGTTGPGAKLDVSTASTTGTGRALLGVISNGWWGGQGVGNYFGGWATDTQPLLKVESWHGSDPRDKIFQVARSGDTPYLTVQGGGNVGVGTASPGQKLDVQGNIKISGAGNGIIFPDGTTLSSASTTPDLYGFFHSTAQCTFLGGYTRYVGSDKICVFPNSNICLGPFVQYQSYTTTGGGVCVGACGWVSGNTCYTQCGGATRTCTIGYHSWSNTNTIESCSVDWGGWGACYHTTTCNAVRTEIGCY